MRAPICVPCEREMKRIKIGVRVEYQNLNSSGEKIFGDQYRCENCGSNIIGAFAERPFAYHFHAGYRRNDSDVIVKERA